MSVLRTSFIYGYISVHLSYRLGTMVQLTVAFETHCWMICVRWVAQVLNFTVRRSQTQALTGCIIILKKEVITQKQRFKNLEYPANFIDYMSMTSRNITWRKMWLYFRYKFVVNVLIAQNNNQGFLYASRSLWSVGTDDYATASFNKSGFFCVVTVHATYFE